MTVPISSADLSEVPVVIMCYKHLVWEEKSFCCRFSWNRNVGLNAPPYPFNPLYLGIALVK